VSPFCTENKFSAKEGKKRKKNATERQGFTLKPEICLMSMLIKQKSFSESLLERGLAEKRVFSLFWLLFSLFFDKKEKKVTSTSAFFIFF
jgi:hypothetical protein